MRRCLFATLALAAVVLATGAAPALTADNGTVSLTVTAQAPPAPCITVTPESFDFGTKPFSQPDSTASEGLVNLTLTNCGTATQNVLAAGTDAIGPGGRWQLTPQTGTGICPLGENKYSLLALGPLGGGPRGIANYLANSPTPLGNDSGVPFPFPPSPAAATTINFFLTMPCQGSVGAGLTQTLSATFTAVVA